MLTRAGTAPPPHVLRFRFALWRRKVQLHVAIAWFKLLVRAQGPLEAAISRWRTVAAAATRLRRAAIAWEHTQPHPVQCQLSRGWAAWSVRWQEAARQRESARRGLLHLMHRTLAAGLRSWAAMAAEHAAAAWRRGRGLSSSAGCHAGCELAAAVVRWRRGMLGAVAMWRGRAHMVRREQARGWQAWLSRQEEVGRWDGGTPGCGAAWRRAHGALLAGRCASGQSPTASVLPPQSGGAACRTGGGACRSRRRSGPLTPQP